MSGMGAVVTGDARIEIVLVYTSGGHQYDHRVTVDLPPGTLLHSMGLNVGENPIVRVPFSMHGQTSLHTVCRENGAIDQAEW
jgi:hypothetical protein